MTRSRIDTALAAQERIERLSLLSAQVSGFALLAVEGGRAPAGSGRAWDRVDTLVETIRTTFEALGGDIDRSVFAARALGLDEQSRRATASLSLARMRALFEALSERLQDDAGFDADTLRVELDAFSTQFAPLLNAMIDDEHRIRRTAFDQVARLRGRLVWIATAVAMLAMVLFFGFYSAVVRPIYVRLELLLRAAQNIGRENFSVALPEGGRDEFGRLFAETRAMAENLAVRKAEVDRDRAHLQETVRDRTERLRAANADLERIDEDRQRFFADFSHELRTPLTVILMEAELGRRGGDAQEAFRVIETRAKRLNRRIDDLLRLARSKSGRIELSAVRFDLCEAGRAAVGDMSHLARRAGMQIDVSCPADTSVTADRDWTRQVIAGLLENAIRHAGNGGRIALTIDGEGGSGRVRIIDNGPGLSDAARDGLFARFTQGESSAAGGEGFGIGLAFAKWVVEEQGGEIEVTSPVPAPLRLGRAPGTMAVILFPVEHDDG